MPDEKLLELELLLNTRNGSVVSAYIRFKDHKVARTREIVEDTLLADYNSRGELVGLDILAPIDLSTVANLVDQPRRTTFRRFIRENTLGALLVA